MARLRRQLLPLALALWLSPACTTAEAPGPPGPAALGPAPAHAATPDATFAPLPPVPAPGKPASGGLPVCGLGKEFHAGRRAALRERLQEGVVLVRGLPAARDYVAFHQDKTFWYLTGVESPGAALLLDLATGFERLYLPLRDPVTEAVEGEQWDSRDEWVPQVSGLGVRPTGALLDDLGDLLEEREVVWISRHPHVGLAGVFDRAIPYDRFQHGDPLDGRPSREEALERRLVERFGVEVRNLAPVLAALRLVKQPEEIDALRRAAAAGAFAMAEAIRSTRPGLGEWEIEALLGFVQRQQGAAGPAYHAIVASGPNSNVLHYSASQRRMQAGEVLLVDAGPERDHYTTDITRTWPVDGAFSPRAAELYDAVLAAQEAALAACAPGATLPDVDEAASRVLRAAGYGTLIRHFTCHYVGLEVHDVGGLLEPLVPGVVLTIEPGLYDEEAGIGVRIEDVVLVTEDRAPARGPPELF